MKGFTAEQYEALFDRSLGPVAEQGNARRIRAEQLGHKAVKLYRRKRIEAGEHVELRIYPVYEWRREASRAKRAKPTEAAQRAQNWKDALRRLIWKMNANFTAADLFLTLTYAGEQPSTEADARRDMQAFLRRVKRWRERHGLSELRYIYVIEHEGDGRKKRVHHHLIMSCMDRDEAERLWGKGRANASKLQPDEYGLEGLARYITKCIGSKEFGKKAWTCSRNLVPPKITTADHKITKGHVERMAADDAEVRRIIERKEPGYMINDVSIRHSDHVAGAYITVRMRRTGQTPGRKPAERMARVLEGSQ